MYDWLLTPAFVLHGLTLVSLLVWLSRSLKLDRREWPFFVLMGLWVVLVLTGHLASSFEKLGTLGVYTPLSFVSLGFWVILLHHFVKKGARAPLLAHVTMAFPLPESQKVQTFLWRFLWISLGLLALSCFVIGMNVYPDNADSMIYRLPRAFWYVSNDSFLHPFKSIELDNRLVYYPLNGVALYIPLVLYGMPGTWHSLPSMIAWVMVVYTAYRFARDLGAPRLWGLFAGWLIGLTPSVLAQSISTNDEIIAACALLVSLYMGLRWLLSGREVYFLMAGMAVALSAGTKLHIVFLLPILAVLALYPVYRAARDRALFSKWKKAVSLETLVTTLVAMIVLFAPFLLYNYLSTGRWYFFNDFKTDVFNLSASFRVGFQNLLIYFSQLIFSPIADMNFWPVANVRQRFNTQLNAIFDPLIRPLLDSDPSHYHLGYRFVGITLPVSVRFVEFSLWSAFVWLLWPWQIALSLKSKSVLRPAVVLFAAIPLFWLVFWSFTTLYMEGTATYFAFYIICAAPAAVIIFSKINRPLWHELRWVTLVLVVVTNALICTNLVMYSGFRALPDLYYARKLPYDWLLTEDRIIKEIRASKNVRILHTHDKQPYFGYMHWNPRATYYTPYDLDYATVLNVPDFLEVLPISGLNQYGFMAFKIPDKATPGLTYLGAVRGIGREAIFANGNGVDRRYPDDTGYIVLQAIGEPLPDNKLRIYLGHKAYGYNENDHLTFEHEVKMQGRLLYKTEPLSTPLAKIVMAVNLAQAPVEVVTIIRSAWSGAEVARGAYLLSSQGSWLPEGSEY